MGCVAWLEASWEGWGDEGEALRGAGEVPEEGDEVTWIASDSPCTTVLRLRAGGDGGR